MFTTSLAEIALALLLLTNLALARTGRLRAAIQMVAFQGWAVGALGALLWSGPAELRIFAVAAVNIIVKGVVLPALAGYAARRANTSFEVEPLVSFRTSQAVVFGFIVAGFILARSLHVSDAVAGRMAVPVAFTTMFTGLFLICSRRKAITQVLGFLVFENGITVFGAGLLLECGIVVELGILLDVFVLVFVLGIAIQQISRTFSSLDTDKLNRLGDIHLLRSRHD